MSAELDDLYLRENFDKYVTEGSLETARYYAGMLLSDTIIFSYITDPEMIKPGFVGSYADAPDSRFGHAAAVYDPRVDEAGEIITVEVQYSHIDREEDQTLKTARLTLVETVDWIIGDENTLPDDGLIPRWEGADQLDADEWRYLATVLYSQIVEEAGQDRRTHAIFIDPYLEAMAARQALERAQHG